MLQTDVRTGLQSKDFSVSSKWQFTLQVIERLWITIDLYRSRAWKVPRQKRLHTYLTNQAFYNALISSIKSCDFIPLLQ